VKSGLQVQTTKTYPAARAIDAFANAGNQHQHHQHQRNDEQGRCRFLPLFDLHAEGKQAGQQAYAHEHRLPQQEMVVLVIRVLGRIGQADGCGIHHHHAAQQ